MPILTLRNSCWLLALAAACGSGDDDDGSIVDRDGGVVTRDGGVARDGGPSDPCGPYAHEDGLGACTSSVAWTAGPPIPGARDHHATTIYAFSDGPYLIVSGGGRDSFQQFYRDVVRIKLGTDGRPVGDWESIGNLPTNLAGHTMLVRQGRVFVTGGANPGGRHDSVYSTWINDDGTLEAWETEPDMPVEVWHHQTFLRDDFLYVVGGQSGNEIAENAVQRARIVDGRLDDWESLTPLPTVLSHHGALATDDGIYVMGGLEDSDFRAEVLLGRFEGDGTIASWETVGLIPGDGLVTPSVGLLGDRIYVVAGLTGGLEFVGTVLSAQILPDGTVTPLVETPTPIPEGRGHVHQMPDLAGRFFVVGGRSGESAGLGRFASLDTFYVGTVR